MNDIPAAELNSGRAERTFRSWIIVALVSLVLLALFLFGSFFQAPARLAIILREEDLTSRTRIDLLETIEAGKNAVLSTTENDSAGFAEHARQSAGNVEMNRKELEALILESGSSADREAMTNFNSCWAEFQSLHNAILNLAVQITNLKAQKLSSTQCARDLAQFEESLRKVVSENGVSNSEVAAARSYEAIIAALHIMTLHKPHIEEPKDEEMDKIEASIKSYDEAVRAALAGLRSIREVVGDSDLKNAEESYDRFMRGTAEVLKLSRTNSNIKSTDLSMGKHRIVSAECENILASLQESIQKRQAAAATK